MINITKDEQKTLLFYLHKARIDAEGMAAIGIASKESVENIRNLIKKVRNANKEDKSK